MPRPREDKVGQCAAPGAADQALALIAAVIAVLGWAIGRLLT
jgi:hypothetical protein